MGKKIVTVVAFVIAGLLLVFLAWRLMTSRLVLISQKQAIQNATQACNSGYGLQPVEQPTKFQTELTTYKKMEDSLLPVASDRPVWVVEMKGRWLLVGGPQPNPASNPEPFYWCECSIVIDAWTGKSLSIPIQ